MLCGPQRALLIQGTQLCVDCTEVARSVEPSTGPPGSGKTSTIASTIAASCRLPDHFTVIVAQTNSAVKNLAAALWKKDITDFKILVWV